MIDIPIPVWNKIKVAAAFDRRYHYRKEGYQCANCLTHDTDFDCFFPQPLVGRQRACTNCARLKKGCHEPSTRSVSASPEPAVKDRQDNNSHASRSKSTVEVLLRQSKSKSSANLQRVANITSFFNPGTSLGKRKARSPEPDHVSSSSHHNSDSDSQRALTTPPSSRINFNSLSQHTASSIPGRKVAQNIPIPSASQLSSSSTLHTPARITNTHETRPKTPQDPPHETQPGAPICAAVRQMEHVNATMVALNEVLEGEIREAEEADRTRRARIYRIESAMKMVNQDVRAADNVLCGFNVNPVSMQDRALLDLELDQYRKMLEKLRDRCVRRDHAAQERQRREQEHRDLLNDELLGRLGTR